MRVRVALQGSTLPESGDLDRHKVDGAGRHVRQIELCIRRCEVVIARQRDRGLEIGMYSAPSRQIPAEAARERVWWT
jgi:hypothetical protein